MPIPSTCSDFHAWLDEQTEIAKREEAISHLRNRVNRSFSNPLWERNQQVNKRLNRHA